MGPRVSKQQGKLIAETSWWHRIFTLGTVYRQVVLRPKKKEIHLYRCYAWFFRKKQRIPFHHVEAIAYGYSDQSGNQYFSYAHDSYDTFSVGLRLLGQPDDIHLFYFYGDGTFTNNGPWPDWMYWDDYLVDMSGTQQSDSKKFVELLSKMIGVSIVPGRR